MWLTQRHKAHQLNVNRSKYYKLRAKSVVLNALNYKVKKKKRTKLAGAATGAVFSFTGAVTWV